MQTIQLRSVYTFAVLLTASSAFAAVRADVSDDVGLRYRGINARGQQFSGVSVAGDLSARVSPGNSGSARASDVAVSAVDKALSPVIDDVIGYDQRTFVPDTTDFPHRAIGYLSTACTGTLIGPRHVLTAAHCVYNINSNQWYTGITFSPARNGNNVPYGTYQMETVYAPQGYTDNHDTQYDYALIVLQQSAGNSVGWMSYEWAPSLGREDIHIVGYPSDKGTGTQQYESECNIDDVNSMTFDYRCSTSGGMSGSSVWSLNGSTPTVHGIHVYALHDNSGASYANSATRITGTVFQQLQYWISRHP